MNAPAKAFPHLHEEVVMALGWSAERRIEFIRDLVPFQKSEAINKGIQVLEKIIAQGPGKRRRNVKMIGEPGVGKSSILFEIERRYPRQVIPGTTIYSMPVVLFRMTAIQSVGAFLRLIERNVGIPTVKEKLTPFDRTLAVIEFLNKAGCRFAAFDEFQDLMKCKAGVRSEIVQLIKLFANEGLFPMCVAGSDDSLAVLSDCKHMRARFRTSVRRPAWQCSDDFTAWFFGLVSRFPIRKPSKIFDKNSLQQIISRSDGNTEAIVIAIRECAIEAIENGSETIDRKALYELLMA